ncbi:MAG: hypothetical protein V5A44_10410 [Haloarculaceae archaeon]
MLRDERDERDDRSRRTTTRRRALQSAVALGVTGIAGCGQIQSLVANETGGGGDGGGGTPTVDPGPDVTDPTPADCDPGTVSGDIEADTTWSTDDCPRVALDGNVRVTNGATLTIEPGVEVVARSGARLTVLPEGTLVASGDPGNPVWFHGEADTEGYWQGINVRSAAPSELENVILRGGGAGDWSNVYLSGSGRAAVTNLLSQRCATSGLIAEGGTTLTEFGANEFRDNADAAISIRTTHLGSIDAGSAYAGGNGTDAVFVSSRDVEDDATWPAVPYRFDGGNHRLFAAVSIDPGAELVFGEGARVTVLEGGSFTAEGTDDSPIVFEGASDTEGYWQGINLRTRSPDNSLDYVEIGQGGAGDWSNLYLSGNAQVSVTNSTFRRCATSGLIAEGGTTLTEFAANEFRDNADAAISIPTTHLGSIDAGSTYAGGNGTDAVFVSSRDVEDDATWPAVPYRFDGGNHRLFAAVSIDPGAELTFGEGARITVLEGGSFTAEGTGDSPIVFEGASAAAGHWQGINLRSTNADNSLDNVEVAYGGAGDWANLYLSGDARASVTNSTFRESATWGLYAEDGVTLEASNNSYENNAEGGVRTPQA